MIGEILRIKTSIPPLPLHVLPRTGIQEGLETGLQAARGFARQLTLVSAPAGFGKTTFVRKWLAGRENRVAWFSLDPEDNRQERFWVYLISALQTLEKDLGSGPLAVLQSQGFLSEGAFDTPALLTPLLNELFALEEPLFLVLDDYHQVNNPRIHEDMIFFIENMPPSLHLVVATRSDPPWPLARWRSRAQMAEIRLEELKFSEEETRLFFAPFKGPPLDESHLSTLYRKTEGWATGLQLAALSLSASQKAHDFIESFAGTHRHVLHFLSEEVLARQPESLREFLLQTSVLKRFNAALCNTVTGREDSADTLARLEQHNLFVIPLDEQGVWYRYHHLFADLLLYQLKRKDPDLVPFLHEKASKGFMEAGEPGEAVRHALAAGGSPEKVVQILRECYEEILKTEGPELLKRILRELPLEALKEEPRLVVKKVINNLIYQSREEGESLLKQAEGLKYRDEKKTEELAGLLAAIKAYYFAYPSDFAKTLENAEKSLKMLPSHDHYWRMNVSIYTGDARLFSGNPGRAYAHYQEAYRRSQNLDNLFLPMTTGFKVATCLAFQGRLREAEEQVRSLLERAREGGLSQVPRAGLLWTLLGELLREKGNLEEAERCIERGLHLSRPEKPSLGWNYLSKTALAFSQRDFPKALSSLREIEDLHREKSLPRFITFPAAAWEARALLEVGEAARAEDVLFKVGVLADSPARGGMEKAYLVLARLLLIKEKPETGPGLARPILEQVQELAYGGGQQGIFLETLLVKSLLEERAGNREAAQNLLLETLEKGLSLGYYQLFLDEGRALASVFTRILKRWQRDATPWNQDLMGDRLRDISREILQEETGYLKPPVQPAREETKENPVAGLVEELTSRELEVLELVSQGLSNQEISEKLFLSPGTVKWYNSNIFGKLGVKNRTQATALARRLELIS